MIEVGAVVRSIAGHDMGWHFAVLSIDGRFCTVADGKYRKLAKPKRKNIVHLARLNDKVDFTKVCTDKQLRQRLFRYNYDVGSKTGMKLDNIANGTTLKQNAKADLSSSETVWLKKEEDTACQNKM